MLLHRELMSFGLSEKEARVYLAALELGATSVQKLSQKAGVNRATTYTNIDVLLDLGLMGSFQKGKKIKFFAEPPEKVISILIEKEEKMLRDRAASSKDLLPQLNSFQSLSDGIPVVRYFDGHEGIRDLMTEMYTRSHEDVLRIMYPHDLLTRFFSENELEDLVAERERRGIQYKAIYTSENKVIEKHGSQFFVPREQFNIGCNVACYGDQVTIVSLEEPVNGIVIEDRNIAQSFKNIFDYIYSGIEDGLI